MQHLEAQPDAAHQQHTRLIVASMKIEGKFIGLLISELECGDFRQTRFHFGEEDGG